MLSVLNRGGEIVATKNIVPRFNGEGGIGTNAKKWLNGFFKWLTVENDATVGGALDVTGNTTVGGNLSVPTINSRNADYGWRTNSTTYSVGNMVKTPSLPSQNCLVCTTAGTSGANEPSYSGKTVGSSVSDGSVVWKIAGDFNSDIVTYDATDVIDLSTTTDVRYLDGTFKVIGHHLVVCNVMYEIDLKAAWKDDMRSYSGGKITNLLISPNTDSAVTIPGSRPYAAMLLYFDSSHEITINVSRPGITGYAPPIRVSGMYWI